MKVLIAEDEYCSRMNLIRQIKECLFHTTLEIFEAENGREAWDIFLGQHPELVLTDIRMPLLDGLELTEMISQSQLYTKVIIVSGFAEFEYAQSYEIRGGRIPVKAYSRKRIDESAQAKRDYW